MKSLTDGLIMTRERFDYGTKRAKVKLWQRVHKRIVSCKVLGPKQMRAQFMLTFRTLLEGFRFKGFVSVIGILIEEIKM